jgi:UDP-2,3-diacylglucosamine pyrophosphatase LpxH
MPNEVASRLWVLSDLHLTPPGEQCVFVAHEALVSLIDHLTETPPAQPQNWLVLNGDVFDHLQIPGYDALSLPLAVQRTGQMLDALDAEPRERNVVQALRRFVACGHRLSCMPGNHDAELNLAPVQQLLSARLGSTTVLPTWTSEWRLEVAGHRVVGRHGQYDDAFNAIGSAQMLRAQEAGDASVPLPPGSRLVLEVINPFRRAKSANGVRRFPFIDALPNDHAVLLAIMLLDPRLAGRRLPAALGIGAAALVRKALMASGLRGQQLGGAGTQTPQVAATDWMDVLGRELTGAVADEHAIAAAEIEHEVDAYFAGAVAADGSGAQTLASSVGGVRGLLLRALARALGNARTSFQSSLVDALARDTIDTWGRGQVALAGHTHAARCILGASGTGSYINTGTWIDQVIPPAKLVAAELPDWLERLRRGEVPLWNGHPVAVVDANGPRLMQWQGKTLARWVDPPDASA